MGRPFVNCRIGLFAWPQIPGVEFFQRATRPRIKPSAKERKLNLRFKECKMMVFLPFPLFKIFTQSVGKII
jgi:hypothetical protein